MKILFFLLLALPVFAFGQITLSFQTVDPKCYGNRDGTIFLAVNGGVPPFAYAWSNGKTSRNINLLAAGTYSVTVTDLGGNQATGSATLLQPTPLTVSFTNNTAGTVILEGSGSTPPYNYSYKSGGVGFSQPQPSGVFLLPAGTYNFKTIDAKGCTKNIIRATN